MEGAERERTFYWLLDLKTCSLAVHFWSLSLFLSSTLYLYFSLYNAQIWQKATLIYLSRPADIKGANRNSNI